MDIAIFNKKLEALRAQKYVGYDIHKATFSYDNYFEKDIQGTDLFFLWGFANGVSVDYIEFEMSINDGQPIKQFYQWLLAGSSSYVPIYDFQHLREFPIHKIKLIPRGYWALAPNRAKTLTVEFMVMQNSLLKGGA